MKPQVQAQCRAGLSWLDAWVGKTAHIVKLLAGGNGIIDSPDAVAGSFPQ